MSGLLSSRAVFVTWQTHCRNPQSRSEAVGVAGNTELVCRTVCTGVGKWLHTLLSHPTLDKPQGFS